MFFLVIFTFWFFLCTQTKKNKFWHKKYTVKQLTMQLHKKIKNMLLKKTEMLHDHILDPCYQTVQIQKLQSLHAKIDSNLPIKCLLITNALDF